MKKLFSVIICAIMALCIFAKPAFASTMPVVQGDLETLSAEGGVAAFDGETLGKEAPADVVTGEEIPVDEDAVEIEAPTEDALTTEETNGGLTEEEKSAKLEFGFYPDRFVESLLIMVMGLVGIFVVTAIIIACMKILNKTTAEKK